MESLAYDRTVLSQGEVKERAKKEAERVCDFLERSLSSLWSMG